MPRRKTPLGFVAYIRVSSDKQGYQGESLPDQRLILEEYAKGMGRELKIVPAIERGHGSLTGRPRYREAIRLSEELGWPLLVLNPSRLSRSVAHLKLIDFRKSPVWVVGRGRLPKKDVVKEVRAAALGVRQNSVNGTLGGNKPKKRSGSAVAKQKSHERAMKGGRGNAERAHRNRLNVQHYLTLHPEALDIGPARLRDALNAAGILNRKSEHPVRDVLWTTEALRPVLRDVKSQIALDNEPDKIGPFKSVSESLPANA